MKIGMLTYSKYPDGVDDDQACYPALRALGHTIHNPDWQDPAIDWAGFDAVIIRSCWDYYRNIPAFRAFLGRLEAIGVRVFNPIPVVRWNMDKAYLQTMQAAAGGRIQVIPAVWVPQGGAIDLAGTLRAQGWPRAVVKPTISAGAYQTWLIDADADTATFAAKQADLDAMLRDTGAMIQQFIPAVQSDGEWSFLFFDGAFSHAVIKRPNAGDFRIQGGQFSGVPEPPPTLVAQAEEVLRVGTRLSGGGTPLYARVDGIAVGPACDQLALMELELIEPRLFLLLGAGAPERFAAAVDRALRR